MLSPYSSVTPPGGGGSYVLDNAAPQAESRFSALAELYDPGTIRHLCQIDVKQGWHCWEIGAGSGSIASWLGERVGLNGLVLATDLDTRFLGQLVDRNVRVRRHNVVSDPLPEQTFHLVHVRLVLVHLPKREEVLDRIIAALTPGGWLLAEEFDSVSYLPAPDRYPWEVALKSAAVMREVMIARGVEPGYGRALAAHARTRGLVNVRAEGAMFMHQGRSLGTQLMRANLEQLREPILASGVVSAREFEADLARLDADDFIVPSPVMWTVAAQRP